MQEKYWAKLTNYKFALCYFDAQMAQCVKINRIIKIVCAIASSAAIAAWAIWQQFAFWWGLIIALSQVAVAVNEFLPYTKRIKELSNIRASLTPLYNEMEKQWFYVSNGSLTDEEINNKCYSFVRQWNEIDDKFFKADTLPQSKKCKRYAEYTKDEYFKTNF